ncbi:hypothetical protein EVAR_49958_1 [Eumeta japonica]|uniref:Pre-C2HC domain-containing protein n=1 Tax=Eumeta variegata TaxID=151549 RepID=A0A4C1XV92_EUMVA|nr:hypothetical protein EVAR_49958_1 [Eumeta japonica]
MNANNKFRSFLTHRGLLDLLREFEDYCASPASPSQSKTSVMEVDQKKEPRKRTSDTVCRRHRPQPPKSPPSQRPTPPRRPSSHLRLKRPNIRLSGVPLERQTPRTLLRLKTLKPPSLRIRRRLVRGVPKELPIEEFKEDLIIQNLLVQSERQITNCAREPLDLVLVTANTTSIDNATKRIFYNVKARVRCVKCLGDHGTTVCTRNKDTDVPHACVLLTESDTPERGSKEFEPRSKVSGSARI